MSSRATIASVLAKKAEAQVSPIRKAAPEEYEHGFRAGASVLVDRLRFAQSVFEQFDGKRSFWKTLGWKKTLEFEDYAEQYERGDIAQRIIDIPAEETWVSFPSVEDAEGSRGAFAKAWARLSRDLNLREVFTRFDRAAGIGRYGTALVGINDGNSLDQPVGRVRSPEDVLYISVFAEGSSSFTAPIEDTKNRRYGKPEFYTLDLSRGTYQFEFDPGRSTGPRRTSEGNQPTRPRLNFAKDIHYSRVLHLAEGRLESDLFGIPRLQPVFNRLYDLTKIVGGSAETFWLAANKGLHANVDPTITRQIRKTDLDRLAEDLELYRDQLVRVLRTTGVEITDLGSDVVNPRGVFSVVASVVAGTTKIPIRMLFPETRGAQTSVADRIAFREEVILPRQTRVAEPQVVRPFVDLMVQIGAMPPPKGGDYSVVWPDPVARSRFDQADIARTVAEAVYRLAQARAFGTSPLSRIQEAQLLGLSLSEAEEDKLREESDAIEIEKEDVQKLIEATLADAPVDESGNRRHLPERMDDDDRDDDEDPNIRGRRRGRGKGRDQGAR